MHEMIAPFNNFDEIMRALDYKDKNDYPEEGEIIVPFKSKKQAKFMFAKHPEIAKEFAAETPSIKSLPNKVKKKAAKKK